MNRYQDRHVAMSAFKSFRLFHLLGMLACACLLGCGCAALASQPPRFAIALSNQILPANGVITFGVDVEDDDSAQVTVTATSDHPGIEIIIPESNRFARLNFVNSSNQPIGSMVAEIFEERGGLAAQRFINLSTNGYNLDKTVNPNAPPFYTNVAVHRIADLRGAPNGLIIQTGDAQFGTGTGGSPLGTFPDQFALQDGLNFAGHGALAMANSGANTNNSQFFITNDAVEHLNGKHMIFGQVISGQEVIDTLARLPRDSNSRPTPTPRLGSVEIFTNRKDATITLKEISPVLTEATVTVTLTDNTGLQAQQQIKVIPLLPRLSTIATDPAGTPFAMTVANNLLYLANGARGIEIHDLADPQHPVLKGSFHPSYAGFARDIEVAQYLNPSRIVAFVAYTEGGLLTLNVTNPANITQLSHVPVDTNNAANLDGDAYDIALDSVKARALVATSTGSLKDKIGGLTAFNLNNPGSLQRLGSLPLQFGNPAQSIDMRALEIIYEGDKAIAYVNGFNFGLLGIDTSSPETFNDRAIKFNQGYTQPWGLSIFDNHLYLSVMGTSGSASGLVAYSFTETKSPTNARSLVLGSNSWFVAAGEQFAVVSHQNGEFDFIDTTNLNALVNRFSFNQFAAGKPSIINDVIYLPLENHSIHVSRLNRAAFRHPEVSVISGNPGIKLINHASVINAGETTEGQTFGPDFTFIIRNDGPEPLTIGTVQIPRQLEVVKAFPAFLGPGSQDTVTLKLTGSNPGLFSAVIRFTSNDFNESPYEIIAQGTVNGTSLIHGTIWHDNIVANGQIDANEPRVSAVGVSLYQDNGDGKFEGGGNDEQISNVQTSVNGTYSIPDLGSGSYWLDVDEHSPALIGLGLSSGVNPRLITVGIGTTHQADFGFASLASDTHPVAINVGWNLLAFPIKPQNQGVAQLQSALSINTSLPVWEWHNHLTPPQYLSSNILRALTGYWFYTDNQNETTISGYIPDRPRIRFFTGWNLIGVPRGVTTITHAAIHPTFWRWEGDHFQATNFLAPGHGFWVHSSQSFIFEFE